ncbi:MAG: poly(A) polymerase [Spirochaetae bacterium HGW-Spirochaetae-8]|nr:MAG: poly(A) polymerase [Spirochaetae bacterium HGW-Spirochaetae-8]
MLIRYKKDKNGSSVPVADIYNPVEHGIDIHEIDLDAVWAIRKLKQAGNEAYIVGGAVRDLMLGRKPKDFDIATSASPRQVQKVFWNARVIGKRFKLVHLMFKDKILEVSTFRSGYDGPDETVSIYGTIEQDAKRRDFTVNSLYYDPTDGTLLDFNHAFVDFKRKRIRSILPLATTFIEDPVRMVRAVKYSVTTGFVLQSDVKRAIRKNANELARVSTSRLTEEVTKILNSGDSADILNALQKHRLLVYMLPCISVCSRLREVEASLRLMDEQVRACQKDSTRDAVSKGEMLKALTKPLVQFNSDEEITASEIFKETFRQVKSLISPMTPANYDVEVACDSLMRDSGLTPPKSCVRTPRPNYGQARGAGAHSARSRKPESLTKLKKGGVVASPTPKGAGRGKRNPYRRKEAPPSGSLVEQLQEAMDFSQEN